ncbi:MAG: hypothetical protein H3C38_02170 [Rhodospirillales bacterium]|nr:hypothetical protein [Rhodospirillales bacterium]
MASKTVWGVALLTGVLTVSGTARAVAAECPKPPRHSVSVRVTTAVARTEYRYDLSTSEIGRLARQEEALSHNRGTMLGLTRSGFDLQLSTTHSVVRTGGGACLWIGTIEAKLKIPAMTVYVSSNYKPGSCEHRAILEHENSHVERTTALLRPYARRLDRELNAVVARLNPVVGRDARRAEKEMMEALQARVDEVMAGLERERARVNDQLDTEESYRRTAARCRSW